MPLTNAQAARGCDEGGRKARICEAEIDAPLDGCKLRRPHSVPAVMLAFVGRPASQRHQTGEIAKHRFAEVARKERDLRARRIDRRAQKRVSLIEVLHSPSCVLPLAGGGAFNACKARFERQTCSIVAAGAEFATAASARTAS